MRPRAALVLFLLASASSTPAQAQGEGYATEEVTITSFDGIELAATVYVPATGGLHPAIILPHGFGSDRSSMKDWGARYAERGWLSLAYDARGFGESGGQIELNGPKEVQDVSVLIDYLVSRADVVLDAEGDPRLGMVGVSYAGGVQLLAAAKDYRIDVLVPTITWNHLPYSLAPNDVVKTGWITALYSIGNAAGHGVDSGNPNTGGLDPQISQYWANAMATGEISDGMRAYLEARSPSAFPGSIQAPALLVQGWWDTLFPPDEAVWNFDMLRKEGVAAKLLLTPGGHGYQEGLAKEEWDAIEARVDAWLAYWLEGQGDPVDLYTAPVEWWSEPGHEFISAQGWPLPAQANHTYFLSAAPDGVTGTLQPSAPSTASRLLLGAGGMTSFSEVPGVQGQLPVDADADAPAASLSYTSDPLGGPLRIVGAPSLRLWASATADTVNLFLKLQDVAPGGVATVLFNQVMPVRLRGADPTLEAPREVIVNLTALEHTFSAGHRVQLTVSTSDAAFAPNRSPSAVGLHHGPQAQATLELQRLPDTSGDVTPPLIATVEPAWDATRWVVRVRASDDERVAGAHLFWSNATRWGALAPVEISEGDYTFHVSPPPTGGSFRVAVSDAAGNQAMAGPFDFPPVPGKAPAGIPGVGLLGVAGALLLAGLGGRNPRRPTDTLMWTPQ